MSSARNCSHSPMLPAVWAGACLSWFFLAGVSGSPPQGAPADSSLVSGADAASIPRGPVSTPGAPKNAQSRANPAPPDVLDEMLDSLGATRKDLTPDAASLLLQRGAESLTHPLTTRLLLKPLDAPYAAGQIAAQYRYWAHSLVRSLLVCVSRTPSEVSRGYFGNPMVAFEDRLWGAGRKQKSGMISGQAALEAGWAALWESAGRAKPSAAAEWAEGLSPEWRAEIGRILYASASAASFRRKAIEPILRDPEFASVLKEIGPSDVAYAMGGQDSREGHFPTPPGRKHSLDLRPAIRALDWDYLAAGLMDLAIAAEDFESFLASNPKPFAFSRRVATPLGWIILAGADAPDVHGAGPEGTMNSEKANRNLANRNSENGDSENRRPASATADYTGHALLIIDLGGNDTYTTGVLGALADACDHAGSDMNDGKQTGAENNAGAGAADNAENDVADNAENDVADNAENDVADNAGNSAGNNAENGGAAANGVSARFAKSMDLRRFDKMFPPVQIIFDNAGDDHYLAAESRGASWGGAILGYSILIDRAGNDVYQGAAVTQGAGLLGAGVLVDRAGDDEYHALLLAQGAAMAGVGFLHDAAGNDRYNAYARAQGCGDARGSGTLLDEKGNDLYILNDTQIVFPAPQSSKHNSSMGQGMGLGQRSDLSDGHSGAGGAGLLYDREGDDSYSAGVFAQGCGFLGGAGLLLDDAGNDSYRAAYYVQGSAAHQAAGILVDRAGNDSYECLMQCAQGSGHDFSIGWLLDEAGNDRYKAKRLAMGAANENGWGFLVDRAGDDQYETTDPPAGADSFGAAKESKWGTMREDYPALGLFLDAGGNDVYRNFPNAGNNKHWIYARRYPDFPFRSERGIGRDGEFPNLRLRSAPLTEFPQSELNEYKDIQKQRRAWKERIFK